MRWTEEDFRLRLHPFTASANLIRASILIASYEVLKDQIIDNLRSFYAREWNEAGEPVDSDRYRSEVLAGAKGRLGASLEWLQRNDVLSKEQLANFWKLRDERNRLAHQLAGVMVDPGQEVAIDLMRSAADIARDIGRFWGRIEVDGNPDFDLQAVDFDGIRSGISLMLENWEHTIGLADALSDLAAKDIAGKVEWGET